MNKKRGPVSYSTYQEAKDRIKKLEASAKEVILEYKEERRSGNCGWAGEEVAALAALLQEDKPHE